MKDQVNAELERRLGQLGYSRVRKYIFKAPWTSDRIDHYIQFRWLQKYGEHVSVKIGIRHNEAQKFALEMLHTFGELWTRPYLKTRLHDSLVSFQLGNLCGWPSLWSLFPSEIGIDACASGIVNSLQSKLRPLVCEIRNDLAMYEFLTQMEIRAMWTPNGAVRAA